MDAKIVNMRLTKIFMAIFAPDERLPTSATLVAVSVVIVVIVVIVAMVVIVVIVV